MSNVTLLLDAAAAGDRQAAADLLPLVYDELRKLAAARMASESPGHSLEATALVHEAWLRLGGDEQPNWQNRAHFFAAAAEAMRRILVDRARRRKRIRHGGEQARVDLAEEAFLVPEEDERVLMVNDGLDRLAEVEPIKAEVVKLRFFVGLTAKEVSEVLGVTERTVERHWAYAKVWLLRHMQQSESA